ncbi:hypothetical protein C8R45DRAFT_1217918 [Mycena sanguinolenta]|nr:hypothetical protein C8R45DRAFT_1217918 [Mycena sanguinolenta]
MRIKISKIRVDNVPAVSWWRAGNFSVRVEASHDAMNTAIAVESFGGVSWEDELHFDIIQPFSIRFTLVATHRVRTETIVGWVEEKMNAGIRSGMIKRQLNATGPLATHISYLMELLSSDVPCASARREAKRGSEDHNVGAGIQAAMKLALCPIDPAASASTLVPHPEPVAGVNFGDFDDLSEPLGALLKHVDVFTNLISKLSEIHPYAKFACSVLTMAQTVVNAQKARDAQLRELMKVTTDVFVFANKLKLPILEHHRQTVKILMLQTTECAYFIRDYTKQKNFIIRAGSTLLHGGAINDKIAEYQKKFKDVQAAFHHDSALYTEITVLRIAERLEQIALVTQLDDLPYASARFDIQKQCLGGTRETVLETIFTWINDSDADTPRVMLLSGAPGMGKSAIAHTVSQRFNQLRRLGSSFFFLKEQPERSPYKLFTTVARDLADLDQGWKNALGEVVGPRALRRTASIHEQFEEFILRPNQRLPPRFGPLVIVIDALDVVGDPVARQSLISILSSRAGELPTNFRVLITARPDSDIWEACHNRDGIKWLAMEALIDKKTDLKDIEDFFDNELSEVPGLRWNDRLCHKLVEKSDGDFGWAAFACKFIKSTSSRITSPSDRVRRLLSKPKAVGNTAHLEADDSESESEGFFHKLWHPHAHQDSDVNAVPSFPAPCGWAEPLARQNPNYPSQFADESQPDWNFVAGVANVRVGLSKQMPPELRITDINDFYLRINFERLHRTASLRMTRFPLAELLLLCLCFGAKICWARIFTAPEQISTSSYDFVVVGAGTAGAVVASRLSENPSTTVLLIEAGGLDNDTDSAVLSTPFLAGQAIGTTFDWNYTTTSQDGLNARTMPFPRGFVMGGSSSINNLVYSRGPSEDWDRIAATADDPGWSWDNIQPFVLRNERHVPAWNNRSDLGEYNPRVHGHGPLMSSLTSTPSELDHRVINTTAKFGQEYPFNLDLNSGWLQTTVGGSARSSSSTAYLHPALNSRDNLDLLLNTQVIKLIATSPTETTLDGVIVAQNEAAATFTFTATKEIILSAGTIGTPQILLLSGIGPSAELDKQGIATLVDSPDVGKNMQDQPIFFLQWEANGTTLAPFLNDGDAIAAALEQYDQNKTGIAASSVLFNTIGFLRLPENSPLLKEYGDPSAGPHSPHFQFAFIDAFLQNINQVAPTTGDWITVSVVLQSPTSRGAVTLASNSAFDHPLIDPAFLTSAFDIGTIVEAVKELQMFLATSAWDGFIGSPFTGNLTTDAEIETFVRAAAVTLKHPVGTATISSATQNGGVVGPHLQVKGVTGLRVVDASVFLEDFRRLKYTSWLSAHRP